MKFHANLNLSCLTITNYIPYCHQTIEQKDRVCIVTNYMSLYSAFVCISRAVTNCVNCKQD
jgi:hypothetical protein